MLHETGAHLGEVAAARVALQAAAVPLDARRRAVVGAVDLVAAADARRVPAAGTWTGETQRGPKVKRCAEAG